MSESDQKAQSSSTLKEFIASVASIRGDLSNITAPPFVLDTKSVVEFPAFWAERPSLFVAPAAASDPAERALLVLKWFLACLKNQQYGGRSEDEGVKKPLNAFLGECFLAKFDDDDNGETMLVSEQVSHHPPVTACRLWNEKHGVYAEGFTRQMITITLGNIVVKQIGHALLTLKNHEDETYLIPLADVKVKGILSGLSGTYPELDGTYTIPCTSGYYSVIEFSGRSFLGGGKKNEFEARVYASDEDGRGQHDPIYTVSGHWNDAFTVYEGEETVEEAKREHIVLADLPTAPLKPLEPKLGSQDPWESRRAWRGVRRALRKGDMKAAAKAKSVLEQGQRAMRKDEEHEGRKWEPLFFKPEGDDPVAAHLYKSILKDLKPEATVAIWKFDDELWQQGIKRPFHGNLTPDNKGEQDNQHINGHMVVVGHHFHTDRESVSSPASFETAHEYPFPEAPQRKAPAQPLRSPPESSLGSPPESSLGSPPKSFLGSPPPKSSLGSPPPKSSLGSSPKSFISSLPRLSLGSPLDFTLGGPPEPPLGPPPEPPLEPPPEPPRSPPPEPPVAKTTTTTTTTKKTAKPSNFAATPLRRRSTTSYRTPQTPTTPVTPGSVSPSSASISPSSKRGRRQRARDSIGKFKISLSHGLQKLPGVGNPNSPTRSNSANRSRSPKKVSSNPYGINRI